MAAQNLELFVFMNCPYCMRVFRYMDEAGIEIPLLDVNNDDEARARLLEVGGKVQVPCLFIDGEPMYESLDIIEWLKENVAGEAGKDFTASDSDPLPTGSACMLPKD